MDLQLNSEHDIEFKNRELQIVTTGQDILKQRLSIALQLLYQEWFLDANVGVPYTQHIFEPTTTIEQINSYFRTEIENIDGVEIINKLEITQDKNNRTITIDLIVNNTITVEVVV
jgi:hypothetical protein